MQEFPLQFVVLWHGGIAEPHFDLMFETYPGSELSTWRSAAWPIEKTTTLTRLKDHRRVYLQFEGDLTRGRGRVERVAGGSCRILVGETGNWHIHFASAAGFLVLLHNAGEQWTATCGDIDAGVSGANR